jgi:hypothetical protein
MKKYKNINFLLLTTLIFSTAYSVSLDEIGKEILGEIWRFHPVSATYSGIHKYDNLLPDYSKKSLRIMANRYKDLKEKMEQIDTLALSVDELVDYHLLKIDLTDEIFKIEMIKAYEKDPLTYINECIDGIYSILIRSAPSSKTKIYAIRERLRRIPGFLENAKQNLNKPPQILCKIGIEQLDEAERLFDDVYTVYKDSLSKKETDDFLNTKNKAVAAIKLFGIWLEKTGDPNVPYTLGKKDYEYKLRYIHYLDIDADSLLKLGGNILNQSNQMIDSLLNLYETPPSTKIELPSDFDKDDVMAYRNEEVAFMRDFVAKSNIVTVPDWIGKLEVVETPGFLQVIIPGIAMQPSGPFDNSKTSYFYVPPLPDKFDLSQAEYYYNHVHNRAFRGWIVHEGYPGHHLQLSIARHHPSDVRKSSFDYFFAEGWALYCEELMARSGLYEDTLGAVINSLYGVRFRAARVIIDVMLQTRKYSYEDAVNFMTESGVYWNPQAIPGEVKRYITTPGQPSSYLVGKLQILDLLDEYRQTMGDKFNLKVFHDELLSHGTIPVTLIRKLILSKIN